MKEPEVIWWHVLCGYLRNHFKGQKSFCRKLRILSQTIAGFVCILPLNTSFVSDFQFIALILVLIWPSSAISTEKWCDLPKKEVIIVWTVGSFGKITSWSFQKVVGPQHGPRWFIQWQMETWALLNMSCEMWFVTCELDDRSALGRSQL